MYVIIICKLSHSNGFLYQIIVPMCVSCVSIPSSFGHLTCLLDREAKSRMAPLPYIGGIVSDLHTHNHNSNTFPELHRLRETLLPKTFLPQFPSKRSHIAFPNPQLFFASMVLGARTKQSLLVLTKTGLSTSLTSRLYLNHTFEFLSTNLLFFLPAPGADDDGSGTVTILEALRGLLASGLKPTRNVEFQWYAAEVCPFFAIVYLSYLIKYGVNE